MTKLFVSDLDGTLLGSSKRITDRTKKAIKEWKARGNEFVIATGRLLSSVEYYADDIECSEDLICCSGAAIYKNKELVHEASVPGEVVERLWKYMDKTNGYCQVYTNRSLIANKRESVALQYENYRRNLPKGYDIPIRYQREFTEELTKNIHKLSFTFETLEEAKVVLENLGNLDHVNVFRSLEHLYDIISLDADKGKATMWLKDQLGIDEVYVAGDNENDTAMLLAFENSLVIEGAPENVLRSAKTVIKKPEEDGLAIYLEKLMAME
ncbi:Cof-type HAD-IIB family hydrolase [Guggenheimella bovis]